jgi:hypothetical protein
VQVDSYGAPAPLKSLCSISVPDSSTLLLTPFDKGSLKDIERAINVRWLHGCLLNSHGLFFGTSVFYYKVFYLM